MVWKKDQDKVRFSNLCRYIVATLESDSPKFSYVGVSLNKEYAVTWIFHMKKILWICCEYLNELHPEYKNDMKLILLYLHTLVSYTSSNTWNILKSKSFEILKTGMNQLCANIMGYLVQKNFYLILKVLFYLYCRIYEKIHTYYIII